MTEPRVCLSLAVHDAGVARIVLANQLQQLRALRGQHVLNPAAGDIMAALPRIIGMLDRELAGIAPDFVQELNNQHPV